MRPPEARSPDALLTASGLPRAESRALLELATGRDRAWLIAHGDEALPPAAVERFGELVAARHAGHPVAYLSGEREFFGRPFRVDDTVLIPRPETEGLIDWALTLPGGRVLDLGTGSGAIAVTLAIERQDWHVEATDISEAAIRAARANAARLGARVAEWFVGSWWSAAPGGSQYDLVVSNPPYVADSDPHLREGDLRHEPALALAAGRDGLAAIETIVAGAPGRLAANGWLLIEHGYQQAAAVTRLLDRRGFVGIETRRDLAGLERLTAGRWPAESKQGA